jgi:glycosyltransferase involved in cell wall biosynthesis
VASRGIQERVTLSGELTGPDKWEAFASADAFCFPSHHPTETFGIVLLEALSFSLPVVATRWRGTADIVEDGCNGFLVPIGDARSLASRMGDLIANPAHRREMGNEGRRRFLDQFTLVRYHDGLRRVFDSVASPTRGRISNGG